MPWPVLGGGSWGNSWKPQLEVYMSALPGLGAKNQPWVCPSEVQEQKPCLGGRENHVSVKIGMAGKGAVSRENAAGTACFPKYHYLFPWFAADLIQKVLLLMKGFIDK